MHAQHNATANVMSCPVSVMKTGGYAPVFGPTERSQCSVGGQQCCTLPSESAPYPLQPSISSFSSVSASPPLSIQETTNNSPTNLLGSCRLILECQETSRLTPGMPDKTIEAWREGMPQSHAIRLTSRLSCPVFAACVARGFQLVGSLASVSTWRSREAEMQT